MAHWEGWIAEKVEELKRLHLLGLSGAQITKLIGAPSRNAVIGKLSRLGLTRTYDEALAKRRESKPGSARLMRAPKLKSKPPHNPLGAKHRQAKPNQSPLIWGARATTQPKPPSFPNGRPESRAYDETSRKLTCIELTSATCKFGTHEEDGDHKFCGHTVREGSSYCDHHHARCYLPTSSAKELTRSLRRYAA